MKQVVVPVDEIAVRELCALQPNRLDMAPTPLSKDFASPSWIMNFFELTRTIPASLLAKGPIRKGAAAGCGQTLYYG